MASLPTRRLTPKTLPCVRTISGVATRLGLSDVVYSVSALRARIEKAKMVKVAHLAIDIPPSNDDFVASPPPCPNRSGNDRGRRPAPELSPQILMVRVAPELAEALAGTDSDHRRRVLRDAVEIESAPTRQSVARSAGPTWPVRRFFTTRAVLERLDEKRGGISRTEFLSVRLLMANEANDE